MAVVINGLTGITTNPGTLLSGSTIGVGGTTPSASGAGITFPATQSASTDANTLDDYEEGTWTPSLGGNTTYTQQQGKYTKVGNLVCVQAQLQVNTLGTGSNSTISGLPFTAASTGEASGVIGYFASLAVNVIQPVVSANGGNTTISVYSRTTAGNGSSGANIFGDSARIFFSISYLV